MSELKALRARVVELMEDNARGALYVEHLKGRVAELQDQIVRLIEAGHLMAEFSSASHRQLWFEAVKEAIK
jgi:regulator of replication initiation timing